MRYNEEKDIRIENKLKDWDEAIEKFKKQLQRMMDGEIPKSRLSIYGSKVKQVYKIIEELIKNY